MQTKKLFNKRRGLSRVLTEIIFLMLATTTALGAYTIYNGYSSSVSGTTKIAIEQVDIIASQNKAYATIKNLGTTVIQAINITVSGAEQKFSDISIAPGGVKTFELNLDNIVSGKQYTVVVKVLDTDKKSILYTATYTVTAKP
ncbi:MAG: hypothetical protein N3F64_00605 [Nitrososphaeria archaeon]|nr:hypothetical protein [Nitrososphaeria archaeon]